VCTKCEKRFSTLETTTLFVSKRSGVLEQFSKSKLLSGVRKAFQGRPINEDELHKLAQKVEDSIRARGVSQIDSYDIGLALLCPLRDLDEIAYLRYASVYRGYSDLNDFEDEIAFLKELRDKRAKKAAKEQED
jgi:transcriptional repressor NrdR